MDKGSSSEQQRDGIDLGAAPVVPRTRALVATLVLLGVWGMISWRADQVAVGLARAATDAEVLFGLDVTVPSEEDD